MKKADYSIASKEERENVVKILHRNANHLIEQKLAKDARRLREIVSDLCERVTEGEIITGDDFETLVSLFQKKTIC